jgi:hypothetical protein
MVSASRTSRANEESLPALVIMQRRTARTIACACQYQPLPLSMNESVPIYIIVERILKAMPEISFEESQPPDIDIATTRHPHNPTNDCFAKVKPLRLLDATGQASGSAIGLLTP